MKPYKFLYVYLFLQILLVLCRNQSSESSAPFPTTENHEDNADHSYYPAYAYESANGSSIICIFSATLAILCFMASFATNRPLATLHLVIVMQLCFLSTSLITNKHPVTNSLVSARFITGFNQKAQWAGSLQNQNAIDRDNILSLGYQTSFLRDFNIMFLLQNFMLIIQLVVFLIFQSKGVLERLFLIFQRMTMLLIIFNTPNLFFSISLMQYDRPLQVILAVIATLQFLLQIFHLLASYKTYLGVSQAFKNEKFNFGLYLAALLVFKSMPCVIFGCLKHEHVMACVMSLVFQLLSCVFLTITRAYQNKYMNIVTLAGQYMLMGFCLMNLGFAIIRQSNQIKPQAQKILGWVQVLIFIGISMLTVVSTILGFYHDQLKDQKQEVISQKSNPIYENQGSPSLIKEPQINQNQPSQNVDNVSISRNNNQIERSVKQIFFNHERTIKTMTRIQNISDIQEDEKNANQNMKSHRNFNCSNDLEESNVELNKNKEIIKDKIKKLKSIKFKGTFT